MDFLVTSSLFSDIYIFSFNFICAKFVHQVRWVCPCADFTSSAVIRHSDSAGRVGKYSRLATEKLRINGLRMIGFYFWNMFWKENFPRYTFFEIGQRKSGQNWPSTRISGPDRRDLASQDLTVDCLLLTVNLLSPRQGICFDSDPCGRNIHACRSITSIILS